MALTLRNVRLGRCVLIGLGGTGVRTLVHIKREFLKNFGGVPPFIQLIGFDTARASRETLPLDGERVSLGQPEFMKLEALEVKRLIQETPEIAAWAPEDKMSMQDVYAGAGQRRPSGRLALFNSAPEIYSRLNKAYDQVIKFEPRAQEGPFRISDDEAIHIFIISSLAGGTGSGMLLDIAHFCRDFLERRDRIHGFLLLAGPYLRIPLRKFVMPNVYGALKELEYWMESEELEEVTYPGRITITWGGEEHRPFDFIYLMNNRSEDLLINDDIDKMLNFIARTVFVAMTVQSGEEIQGGGLIDLWPNLVGILDAAAGSRQGERYIGVGMANLEVPVEKTITSSAYQTALRLIIDNLLASDPDVPIVDFVHDRRMEIDHVMDELMREESIVVEEPDPDIHRREPSAVQEWKDDQISKLEQRYSSMASSYGETHLEQLGKHKESIRSHVKGLLAKDRAIGNAQRFLESLYRYFDQEQRRIEEERNQKRQKREEIEYPEKELERAFFGGGWTPKKTKVWRVIAQFSDRIKEEGSLIWEVERRNAAIDLLGALKTFVSGEAEGSLRKQLSDLEKLLQRAHHMIRVQFDKLRAKPDLEDKFSARLGEEFLAKDVKDIREMIDVDFLLQAWAEQPPDDLPKLEEEDGTLLGWTKLTSERLAEWLFQAVQGRFSAIAEDTIEDALERMVSTDPAGEAKIIDAAQRFVNKTTPLWRFQTLPGKGADIREILIFGLPDRPGGIEASYFKNTVRERLDLGTAPESGVYYAVTWEKYRLRALKLELPIAVSWVKELKDYKQDYLMKEGQPDSKFTAHIHKDWVGPASLPDIGIE